MVRILVGLIGYIGLSGADKSFSAPLIEKLEVKCVEFSPFEQVKKEKCYAKVTFVPKGKGCTGKSFDFKVNHNNPYTADELQKMVSSGRTHFPLSILEPNSWFICLPKDGEEFSVVDGDGCLTRFLLERISQKTDDVFGSLKTYLDYVCSMTEQNFSDRLYFSNTSSIYYQAWQEGKYQVGCCCVVGIDPSQYDYEVLPDFVSTFSQDKTCQDIEKSVQGWQGILVVQGQSESQTISCPGDPLEAHLTFRTNYRHPLPEQPQQNIRFELKKSDFSESESILVIENIGEGQENKLNLPVKVCLKHFKDRQNRRETRLEILSEEKLLVQVGSFYSWHSKSKNQKDPSVLNVILSKASVKLSCMPGLIEKLTPSSSFDEKWEKLGPLTEEEVEAAFKSKV